MFFSNKLLILMLILCSAILLVSVNFLIDLNSIIKSVSEFVPLAATAKSKGSFYPNFFHPTGFSLNLELQINILSASVLIYLLNMPRIVDGIYKKVESKISAFTQVINSSLLILLLAVVFIAAVYLSLPPDAYPANARMHWVEKIYPDPKYYTIRFIYTANMITNTLFYNYPHILMGLLAVGIVYLAYEICVGFEIPKFVSALIASLVYFSPHLTNFITMAEDVHLNIFLILLSYYCYQKDWAIFLGVSCFIATLGRFQFTLIPLSIFVVELAHFFKDRPHYLLVRIKWVFKFLLSFALLFLVWHIYLYSIDSHFLFSDGGVYQNLYNTLEPQTVDGFKISKFSGAYFLHALWIFPLSIWLASGFSLYYLRSVENIRSKVIFTVLICFVLNLALHEASPLFYFNYRYIIYWFPILYLTSIFIFWQFCSQKPRLRSAVLFFVIFSSFVGHGYLQDKREQLLEYRFNELFAHRHYLQKIAKNYKFIVTEDLARHERNFLSYIFKLPQNRIKNFESSMQHSGEHQYLLISKDNTHYKEIKDLGKWEIYDLQSTKSNTTW